MTVIRTKHDGVYPSNEYRYETDLTDIREVAAKYGQTEDTLKLFDDNGELVAVATWPQGYKVYKYATEPDLQVKLSIGFRAFSY